MKTDEIRRIFDLAEFCSDNYGNTPAFYDKKAGNWHCLSWSEFYENSKLLALGLISDGVKAGDNLATIFSYNSSSWNMLDMALAQIGAIHVPIYPTISDSDYLFILCQIEAKLIFVSDQYIYNKLTSIQSQIPTLKNIVSVERLANVYSLQELVELGRNSQDSEIAELKKRKAKINPDEVVSIIYTSGTSGFPKGVMLTHKNLISSMLAMAQAQPIERGKKVLSFLPMCHVFERVVNYQSQYKGLEIYYCENLKALMKNLLEVKPHATTVVPRVLEKIIKTVLVNGRKKNFFIRFFIVWAVRFGYKYKPYRKTTAFYRLKHKIAYYFVYQIVRHFMGGKIEYIGCGGAALNIKIASFFWAAKMPVYEGYGLTECSPLVALNFPGNGNYWFGSVGPVVDGTQVKIASDGEILVKGNNVMKGYFQNSELTEETMVDDWLKTGDLGLFLEGQYLQITGRKKQMFKTSFGKYIVPQAIENKFSSSPYIEYVIVIGEGKHCAAAIISPNFEYIRTTFKIDKKISNAKLIKRTDVVNIIKAEIKKINHQLGKTEQLKKHLIVPHNWSPETGEVSPTMKLKRNIIIHKYNRQIHALYQDDSI